MPSVPEFLLRKLYIKNSLSVEENGFSFQLLNTLSPATILWFSLEVGGQTVPPESLQVQIEGQEPVTAGRISSEKPYAMPLGKRVTVKAAGIDPGSGDVRLIIHTREVGSISFSIREKAPSQPAASPVVSTGRPADRPPAMFNFGLGRQKPIKADVTIRYNDVIGRINPYIYGQFIEHLEDCVYNGVWTADGAQLRPDTLKLIQELHPPLLRYPGGNFASGYHWEDGIGPKDRRPARFDEAWKAPESNQVGTDEFMELCRLTGAHPYLVVNCGNGTAQEAARWVAYCNDAADTEQGRRRAANGHPDPYGVKLWGVGNEVWGAWQIGHSDAETYTQRLREFAGAMKAADPAIQLVAVGQAVMSDDPHDAGRLWNETVLRGAGDLIDYLSFHLYQPDRAGWQDEYDPDALYKTMLAAPLDAERIIARLSEQIHTWQPERRVGLAFDEWNAWLPAPQGAPSMHKVIYTMRDALYVTGMLNVFMRQCEVLQIANLAQLVNVLPLIVTNDETAYATPLYYPFVMYRQMQEVVLRSTVFGRYFDSEPLGNISAVKDVPYVEITPTRSEDGGKLVVSILNRHPVLRTHVNIDLKDYPKMKLSEGWLLHVDDMLAANSFDEPQKVKSRQIGLPEKRGTRFRLDLPPMSLSILSLKKL